MANRKNVHIVQRDNGWGTLREGGQRATQVYDTQAQAIQAGRQMARQGQGELLIHGENGRIRARDSYGNDPCPPEGQQMITFDIKMPSVDDLMRAAMEKVEQQITEAAQEAAAPHGGVKVQFARDSEGNLVSVEFEGSEAAVEAAQAAVAD